MLRQYEPQRCRLETLRDGRARYVGTVPVGTIFRMVTRLSNEGRGRLRTSIVESWYPRRISGVVMATIGHARVHGDTFVARGGHLARVRCLTDGKRTTMSDTVIRHWIDLDPQHVETFPAKHLPRRRKHRALSLRVGEGRYPLDEVA